eukprot:996917-Amphidinium_carterae.1
MSCLISACSACRTVGVVVDFASSLFVVQVWFLEQACVPQLLRAKEGRTMQTALVVKALLSPAVGFHNLRCVSVELYEVEVRYGDVVKPGLVSIARGGAK